MIFIILIQALIISIVLYGLYKLIKKQWNKQALKEKMQEYDSVKEKHEKVIPYIKGKEKKKKQEEDINDFLNN